MTNKQAAQILREHKRLVRGADSFTRAIDKAITALDQPEPDELERFKAAVLLLFPWESDAMRWMCVDSDGEIKQGAKKPENTMDQMRYWYFPVASHRSTVGRMPWLPDGIDWRDCLIERH